MKSSGCGCTKYFVAASTACPRHVFSTFLLEFNPIALRKTKIVYNFGLSECSRVKQILNAS